MVLRLAYTTLQVLGKLAELIVTHMEHKNWQRQQSFCRLYDDQETRIKVLSKSLED